MSVRQSLLAILDQGPCYGYQLRAEFERRTGSSRPLNVGQIYNTLDRLERDGFVQKGETDSHGHVYYAITDAGSAAVASWLAAPVERSQGARDELATKLAVATSLPGVDVAGIIRAQQQASRAQLDELTRVARAAASLPGPQELGRTLIAEAGIAHAEAELRWLEETQRLLSRHPEAATPLALASERPKRGRPARVETVAIA
ncbi:MULTISPECIES: PadR family transcriptional regulator [unclassified Microbacterium]|uniref:PadR family transcriptional regulator n=1 Tax=unclassified Microbacterium TaxID=2609290 RepID=UPI00214BBC76|nr:MULTISPECIES: PadR family transcriptional regulator [unclassified Microbacterium]MCR2810211.1 PadR family transcriptional regulator [Microbacterium sp. zg.B185]WIM19957.1 PadR family transcriptional regulator [Microbacterium sp. zg-B185]